MKHLLHKIEFASPALSLKSYRLMRFLGPVLTTVILAGLLPGSPGVPSCHAQQTRNSSRSTSSNADRVIDRLQKALEADPDSVRLNYSLALAYHAQKKWREAIPYFWKVTELDPDNAEAFFYLGESWGCVKEMEKEATYLRRAISLKPLDRRFHSLYASGMYFCREEKKSHTEYLIMKELIPSSAVQFQKWLDTKPRKEPAVVQLRYCIKRAAYFFRRFLTFLPTKDDFKDAAYRLGLKRGSKDDELKYLAEVNKKPDNPEPYFILGYINYRRGNLKPALSYYRQAQEHGFRDYKIYYWMGRACLENGDPWNALRCYEILRKHKHPLAPRLFARLYPI